MRFDPSDGACDGDANLARCTECDDPYDASEYESCPVCWQMEGVPPLPDSVPRHVDPDDEPTARLERETNEDVQSGGLR